MANRTDPDDCPVCFDCNFQPCRNFGQCNALARVCDCPAGFGGPDCLTPLCGSLASPNGARLPRPDDAPACACAAGWGGVNCNVCQRDSACAALLPPDARPGARCFNASLVAVHTDAYSQCVVANKKIRDGLGAPDAGQVTIGCSAAARMCRFQFWVRGIESFSCSLEDCNAYDPEHRGLNNAYRCNTIRCECIPGRYLCGGPPGVDISDLFKDVDGVRGPGDLVCEDNGARCRFSEPAMDKTISELFGDEYIELECTSGECMHASQVPGFSHDPQQGQANTLILAAAIVCSVLFLFMVILWWFRNRAKAAANSGYLPISQAELDRLMADHVPATLSFVDIRYRLAPEPAQEPREILHGIHGVVHPGQVMAIMGGSGAGKSTCLDILARRNKTGTVEGDLRVNRRVLEKSEYKQMIGFVDQQDVLLPTLTVEETILYSALLRLPKNMSYEAKVARVRDTMVELGILHIAKMRIGDETKRGISGGEKRRVSIACELVTSPSILFLDEPTSGLDAYNAHNVVDCLVTLARTYNRTVVFTIHQPRSDIYAMFDQLVLLSQGHLIYSGDAAHAVSHFASCGYPCPVGYNIADFLIDLTMDLPGVQAGAVPSTIPEEGGSGSVNNISGPSESAPATPMAPKLPKSSESAEIKPSDPELQHQPHPGTHLRPPTPSRPISNLQPQLHHSDDALLSSSLPGRSIAPNAHAHRTAEGYLRQLNQRYHMSPAWATVRAELQRAHPGPGLQNNGGGSPSRHMNTSNTNAHTSYPQQQQQPPSSVSLGNAVDPESEPLLSPTTTAVRSLASQRAPLSTQFRILADRTLKNLYRDPLLLLSHYTTAVTVAVLCGCLFWGVTADIAGFQNRMGCFFFVCALFAFSCMSSLHTFATERILFMRERANGYYSPGVYFAAKVLCDLIPLRVIPPLVLGCIMYNMVGLVNTYVAFFKFQLVLVLFNVTAAALCLLISLAVPEVSVASLVASLCMLFSMLFGGLLLNKDTVPASLGWLKHFSFFNFAMEALVVNELKDLQLTERKYGMDVDVPAAVILSTFGFNPRSYWADVYRLAGMGAGFLATALLILYVWVREKR